MYFPSGDMTELVTGASGGFEVMRCSLASDGAELIPRRAIITPATNTASAIDATRIQYH